VGSDESFRLFIDGDWVEPANGRYPVINPATEGLVAEAPEASRAQVDEAASAARAAFKSWSRTAPERRAEIMSRTAEILTRRSEEFVALGQAETGATPATVRALHIGVAIARFHRYARGAMEPVEIPLAPAVTETTALSRGGLTGAVAVRQPVGVVTCITSYNNPWANPAGKVAPALAMGNTVVVKPAPQNPLSVYRMAEALAEAGLPPGVFNVVSGASAEVGEAAVASPDVDMISFTGSTGVGMRIAEVAASGLKRTLLELGGKGAAVVFDDADLESAVAGIGTTFSFYSGQICTAPTRVVAQRGIYEELVDRLAAYAESLRIGDPTEPATVVGPVISAAHRDRVNGYVAVGQQEGAQLVTKGALPDVDRGFYVAPAVLAGCETAMRVVQEEIFGPVVVVQPFADDDEGIDIANDTPFGLIDYVWSRDTARAYRAARQLRAGGVGVNTVGRNMEAPFGGFKHSGIGRDVGSFALHAYSELQSIVWPS
jgi:acyl-CoA reductase-like NAD-dependent aldehyde dehydrogenase